MVPERVAGERPAVAAKERVLIEGCRAGEPHALDELYRTHVGRVTRTIGRLVGPTPDLEDLVQTTFIEAIRSLARYRGEAALATWLVRIGVHVAQHHLRRGVRRTAPLEVLRPEEEPREPATADQVLDDRRLALRVHALLDRITPRKRIAFLLYTVEGHSIEEVAALMDAGHAATKSRIWFARRELLALARLDPALRDLADGGKEPA